MSIVRKPALTQLFDRDPTNPFQDRTELMKPRVHNKHHGTAPADAVYIGRGSKWGNPYAISQHATREAVIERFRVEVLPHLDLRPLKGKHLVCFCKPRACHGDLLLEAANQGENT